MEITIKLNDANPGEGAKLMSVLSILQGGSAMEQGMKAGSAIADMLNLNGVRPFGESITPQGFAGPKEFFEEHVKAPTAPESFATTDIAKALKVEIEAPSTVPEIQEDFVEGPAKHSEYDETIDLGLELLGGGVVKKVITAAGHVDKHGIMLMPKDPYPAVSIQLKIIADLKKKMEGATAPKEEPAKEEPAKEEPQAKPMTDKQFFDFCTAFGEKYKAALAPIARKVNFITTDGKPKHIKTAPAELRAEILRLCAEHEASVMAAQ